MMRGMEGAMDKYDLEQMDGNEIEYQAHCGDAEAQYYVGRNIAADDAEAAKWYRLAAEQGHARARFNLGVMYYLGDGVPRDWEKAAKWYRLAADQGDADAQFHVGLMCEKGDGVSQDNVLAYKWITLSGYGWGSRQLFWGPARNEFRCREVKERIANKLTAAQLAEALRLAREWQPTTGPVEVTSN
jgi:hypothetical protein